MQQKVWKSDYNWATSWQNQQCGCAQRRSESLLCAQWVAKAPSFLHADSEDSDQPGRMPRLIWVFAGHTATLLVLSQGGSNKEVVQKNRFEYRFCRSKVNENKLWILAKMLASSTDLQKIICAFYDKFGTKYCSENILPPSKGSINYPQKFIFKWQYQDITLFYV